jgi:hypothetical protein
MNIILRDERRVTALRHVDAEEYQAIVKLFIQRGANVDAEGGEMTAPDVDPKYTIDTATLAKVRHARTPNGQNEFGMTVTRCARYREAVHKYSTHGYELLLISQLGKKELEKRDPPLHSVSIDSKTQEVQSRAHSVPFISLFLDRQLYFTSHGS